MVITVAHRSPSWAGLRNVLLPWKLSQLLLILGKLGLGEETMDQMQLDCYASFIWNVLCLQDSALQLLGLKQGQQQKPVLFEEYHGVP